MKHLTEDQIKDFQDSMEKRYIGVNGSHIPIHRESVMKKLGESITAVGCLVALVGLVLFAVAVLLSLIGG